MKTTFEQKFESIGLSLIIGNSLKFPDKPTAMAHNIKGKFKAAFNYRFSNAEAMETFLEDFYNKRLARIKEDNERKEAKRQARINLVNPFKEGDIFYQSWGYDQTNIDFYIVLEAGKKSVKITRIGQIVTRDAGFMCEYVKPDPNYFPSDEVLTKIVGIGYDNKPKISDRHGYLNKWDREEIYQSHYA